MLKRVSALDKLFLRHANTASAANHVTSVNSGLENKFWNVWRRYENFIGISDVNEAQARVIQAEQEFLSRQAARSDIQERLSQLQQQLKEMHGKLDKIPRGDDRYLEILTQEHKLIKDERSLSQEFRDAERQERLGFSALSARLRESHEKERAQSERTKYLSIIGSVISAILGFSLSAYLNQKRIQDFRSLITETSDPSKLHRVLHDLSDMVTSQQNQIRVFVSDLRGLLLGSGTVAASENDSSKQGHLPLIQLTAQSVDAGGGLTSEQILTRWDSLHDQIVAQDERLAAELADIKHMIAAQTGYGALTDGTVIYVGPEMQHLFDQTEQYLEWRMKVSAIATVTLIYAALAITLPIVAAIFGGTSN